LKQGYKGPNSESQTRDWNWFTVGASFGEIKGDGMGVGRSIIGTDGIDGRGEGRVMERIEASEMHWAVSSRVAG
jgi:hypothetical protein